MTWERKIKAERVGSTTDKKTCFQNRSKDFGKEWKNGLNTYPLNHRIMDASFQIIPHEVEWIRGYPRHVWLKSLCDCKQIVLGGPKDKNPKECGRETYWFSHNYPYVMARVDIS